MKQEKDEIDKSFENFLKEAPEKPIVDPKTHSTHTGNE